MDAHKDKLLLARDTQVSVESCYVTVEKHSELTLGHL